MRWNWRARFSSAVATGAVLICLIVFLLASSLGALGNTPGDGQILQTQQELDQMKERIITLKAEISKLRREGKDIELILVEIERKRSVTTSFIRTIDSQLEALERDIGEREISLREKEAQIEEKRVKLRQALVHYYKTGRVNTAELLVSSQTFSEIFSRAHYWARMIKNIRQMIEQVAADNELIMSDLREIESRRAVTLQNRAEKNKQLREMADEETAKRRDRTQLTNTIARYEAQAQKLLAAQKKTEELLAQSRRRMVGGAAGDGLAALKGRLSWPVKGKIITRFGTHVHPKYGTRVRQQGVEIAAAEGTAICAVSAGRVVFADWLEGYGNTVIIDHGKEFFSLYGHASTLLVQRDDMVAAGQVVGRVGSTDSFKGANLHFEIRRQSEALNPVHWLKR